MGTERKAKLKEWSLKLDALQGMLQEQESAFKQREGIATDLETVKFKRSEIEVIVFLFQSVYIACFHVTSFPPLWWTKTIDCQTLLFCSTETMSLVIG